MGMTDTALQTVRRYHEATKHRPHRYARSLGYLDWATQPDPFRRYAGAEWIELPIPEDAGSPSYDAIYEPGAVPAAELHLDSLARFFFLALAISAWKQAGPSRWALRCNPSSGNLHPTEGYGLLPTIPGFSSHPGVYHYTPHAHGLERRAALNSSTWTSLAQGLPPGAFLVGLSSILWREAWKYGERAFRYCQHDVGHALGALRFAAAVLGWRASLVEGVSSNSLANLLGLERSADFEDAEIEEPELLCVVSPGPVAAPRDWQPASAAIESVARARWSGHANRLSSAHVEWEIIDEVAAATRTAGNNAPLVTPAPTGIDRYSIPPRAVPSAFRIIRQRRSAVDFDGRTGLSAEAFYRMLGRITPAEDRPPWDAIPWPPRIDLLLFVHLVDGLVPGVYALIREPQRLAAWPAASRSSFTWVRPPGCPPGIELFELMAGDARSVAAQLSLGQAIAGNSAFSLGMIADFEAALVQQGPSCYRRLYWEAGLIGQVLYLEAEAAGLRGTGIGAFFDDLVHELVGFSGRALQSIYHFTIGGPVDDGRITTWPAYQRG